MQHFLKKYSFITNLEWGYLIKLDSSIFLFIYFAAPNYIAYAPSFHLAHIMCYIHSF